jgi:arylsulfatase A-like enzyme
LPSPRAGLSLALFLPLALALLAAFATGCERQSPVQPVQPVQPIHDGPIVFITLNALRADVVSALGGADPELTPNLDKLVRSADWAGRAIAPSSWVIPSTAALLTGLRPWQNQVLCQDSAVLAPDLLTLPEALRAAGYSTHGYYHGHWMEGDSGYGQGFDSWELLGDAENAVDRLSRLPAGRELVFVHIPEPQPPYVRRSWLQKRVKDLSPDLPPQVRSAELAKYQDPAVPLPPDVRRRFWDLYRLHVAWADEKLGRLLDALHRSGQWDRTLLIVTATYGEALSAPGEALGATADGLDRQRIEVPLAIKLPAGWRRPIAAARSERVATLRLWATMVEAAGGPLPPAVAPSLFARTPKPLPVLSELYCGDGTNTFSLVDGDDQLLWESRFAPPEPEYYRARLAETPGVPPLTPPLREDSEVILGRLATAFAAARPFSGLSPPRLSLRRFAGRSGSRRVDDPKRQAELAARLARAWHRFVPEELSPDEEDRARELPPPPPAH